MNQWASKSSTIIARTYKDGTLGREGWRSRDGGREAGSGME